jgi:hypothetical protein
MNTTTKTAAGLPDMAFAIHPSEPGTLIRVYRGESGYFIEARYNDPKLAKSVMEGVNGPSMTRGQVEAMLAGSMFGWSCPASDPESYMEDGTMKPRREYDIAFQGRVKAIGYSHHQACAKAAENMAKVGVEAVRWGGSIGKEI